MYHAGLVIQQKEKASITEVTIIGVDLAKRVFQLHGAAAGGEAVFRKKLTQPQFETFMADHPRCVVAMEACATAHHWATRASRVRSSIETINALRGHLAEFGLIAPQGPRHVPKLLADALKADIPALVRELATLHGDQIDGLEKRIADLTARIEAHNKRSEKAHLLTTMPGIGKIEAITIEAFAPDISQFETGRDFAASLGPVPRQHSSGGKTRLGKCSKAGQRDIRRLLITGAMSVIAAAKRKGHCDNPWLADKLARKPRPHPARRNGSAGPLPACRNKKAQEVMEGSLRKSQPEHPVLG